jgi:hypothetical protein
MYQCLDTYFLKGHRLILIDDIRKEVIAYYYLLIVIYINATTTCRTCKTSLIQKGLKL